MMVMVAAGPGVHNRGGLERIWNYQLADVCRVTQKTSVDPQSEWLKVNLGRIDILIIKARLVNMFC